MKIKFMNRAIELASKGEGFVVGKALYGLVIVKKDKIIAEGFRDKTEHDNIEINLIKQVKEGLKEAEVYINIEPKLREEQIKKIVHSGIKKIYIGILDPIEKGRFVNKLRKFGIEVEVGLLEEENRELNEIYIHYKTTGKPFVVTKWAMTLDGKLAAQNGDSKWISNESSLYFVHKLRQRCSGILVGENTVKLDNPMLTTRLEGVEVSNPIRIIISKTGDIPKESKVLKVSEGVKTIVVTAKNLSKEREQLFYSKNVDIIKLEANEGHFDFNVILEVLAKRGIDSILIEGGSSILGSAFDSKVVNKVYGVVAPKILGGGLSITPVGGHGIEYMRDAIELKNVKHEIVGNDVIFRGYV